MGEFTPITNQETLDAVLKDRLNRQHEKHAKELEEVKAQYADYDELKKSKEGYETKLSEMTSELEETKGKLDGINSQIEERDKVIKAYEMRELKTRVASELELPREAIEFLHGESEDEIRESAEKLARITPKKVVAPLANNEPVAVDEETQALKTMLANLI